MPGRIHARKSRTERGSDPAATPPLALDTQNLCDAGRAKPGLQYCPAAPLLDMTENHEKMGKITSNANHDHSSQLPLFSAIVGSFESFFNAGHDAASHNLGSVKEPAIFDQKLQISTNSPRHGGHQLVVDSN